MTVQSKSKKALESTSRIEVSGKVGAIKITTRDRIVAIFALVLIAILGALWMYSSRPSGSVPSQSQLKATPAVPSAPLPARAPQAQDVDEITQTSTGVNSPNVLVLPAQAGPSVSSHRKINQNSHGRDSENRVERQ